MKKIIALALVIIVAFAAFQSFSGPTSDDATLRRLSSGDIVGFADKSDTYAWLGIPFAQPPLGDLRWRAPQPIAPWSGTREALHFSSKCAQLAPFSLGDRHLSIGSEDCLYLNVWTPRIASTAVAQSKLPVMVWIHGGANTLGTASATKGYQLAGSQNVIVVSLQYRLGLLGWMSLPALRNSAQTSLDATSNFALLDMIAGLQWVQNNIAAFGGDPHNVTIFGQSAGGADVLALLAAPPAKGLFHRAIAESAWARTLEQTRAENYSDDSAVGDRNSSREFINQLLIVDGQAHDRAQAKQRQQAMSDAQLLDYLRSKSPKQLFAVTDKRSGGLGYSTPTLIRDGIVLPHAPLTDIFSDANRYNHVPLIIGSNRSEFKLFLWLKQDFVERRLGFIPVIKNLDDYNRTAAYFSDMWEANGVSEVADMLARSQPEPVFGYRFDWADQPTIAGIDMRELFGAAHGIETVFIFGRDATVGMTLFAKARDKNAERQLSATMMSYWANFAKTGTPGNGGSAAQPEWAPWPSTGGARKMLFDIPAYGGVRMSEDTVRVADIKNRLRTDAALATPARCERYAQLFFYERYDTYWSDAEYADLGCAQFPLSQFKPLR